jgi:phytoene dehydrogenase-like protein
MTHKVDVAIVGSGPAGAIVGAYLAKAGLKTVVFEREKTVGGLKCGSHKIAEGFITDDYLHNFVWCIGLNDGRGYWPKAAEEVGATIKWVCMPNPTIYFESNRKKVTVPYCSNGKAFAEFVSEISPVPLPKEIKGEIARIVDEALKMPPEELWSPEAESMSFGAWLKDRTNNEVVKAIFEGVVSSAATEATLDETSLAAVVSLILQGVQGGRANYVTILGGPQGLIVRAFCDVIAEHGGEVLTDHMIRRVVVDGDVAKGVVAVNPAGVEKNYEAKYVVIATQYQAVTQLLGQNTPERVRQSIKNFDKNPDHAVTVHWALKSHVANTDGSLSYHVFGEDHKYKCTLGFPSNFDPSYAPPGKQQVIGQRIMSIKEFRQKNGEGWIEELTNIAERVFPGFKKEIEAVTVNDIGPVSAAAFAITPKVPLECPEISKLYFAGDYVVGKGVGPERSAYSAMTVAKKILRQEGKFVL